jgi:hypothetical protein
LVIIPVRVSDNDCDCFTFPVEANAGEARRTRQKIPARTILSGFNIALSAALGISDFCRFCGEIQLARALDGIR